MIQPEEQKPKELEDAAKNAQVATDIVTDIIEDVLMSTTKEPSVASVVFDTFKDFVSPEEAAGEEENAAQDKGAGAEYSLDDIIDELPDDKSQPEPEEKKEIATEPVPLPVPEKENTPEVPTATEEDSNKTITFSGKPVPEAGTVVVNGFVSPAVEVSSQSAASEDNKSRGPFREKESPQKEKEPSVAHAAKKDRAPEPQKSEGLPSTSVSQGSNKTPAPVPAPVPQTDLDTFETKMSTLVEDLDKKSDSGSVNTEDSIGDVAEPEREAETVQVQRRQKGNIRQRNVRYR